MSLNSAAFSAAQYNVPVCAAHSVPSAIGVRWSPENPLSMDSQRGCVRRRVRWSPRGMTLVEVHNVGILPQPVPPRVGSIPQPPPTLKRFSNLRAVTVKDSQDGRFRRLPALPVSVETLVVEAGPCKRWGRSKTLADLSLFAAHVSQQARAAYVSSGMCSTARRARCSGTEMPCNVSCRDEPRCCPPSKVPCCKPSSHVARRVQGYALMRPLCLSQEPPGRAAAGALDTAPRAATARLRRARLA